VIDRQRDPTAREADSAIVPLKQHDRRIGSMHDSTA
jgi:hypothetical protein